MTGLEFYETMGGGERKIRRLTLKAMMPEQGDVLSDWQKKKRVGKAHGTQISYGILDLDQFDHDFMWNSVTLGVGSEKHPCSHMKTAIARGCEL